MSGYVYLGEREARRNAPLGPARTDIIMQQGRNSLQVNPGKNTSPGKSKTQSSKDPPTLASIAKLQSCTVIKSGPARISQIHLACYPRGRPRAREADAVWRGM